MERYVLYKTKCSCCREGSELNPRFFYIYCGDPQTLLKNPPLDSFGDGINITVIGGHYENQYCLVTN